MQLIQFRLKRDGHQVICIRIADREETGNPAAKRVHANCVVPVCIGPAGDLDVGDLVASHTVRQREQAPKCTEWQSTLVIHVCGQSY